MIATMIITSVMIGVFAAEHWQWSRFKLTALIGLFLLIDFTFLAANLPKIPNGGWFPLVAATLVFYVMTTWRTGRRLLSFKLKRAQQPMKAMIASLARSKVHRIEGTAVYLFPNPGNVPPAFLANLRHNQAVHESVVFLAVKTSDMPRVPRARRDDVTHLGSRFLSGDSPVRIHGGTRRSNRTAASNGRGGLRSAPHDLFPRQGARHLEPGRGHQRIS